MALAGVLQSHKDAMICDLAEYYGIFDYRNYPALFIATLVLGLRADSRVKGELAGYEQPPVGITLVTIFDAIQAFAFAVAGGKKAPQRALNAYLRAETATSGYRTGEEFKAAWNAKIKRYKKTHGE